MSKPINPRLKLAMMAEGLVGSNPQGKEMQRDYREGKPFRNQLENIRTGYTSFATPAANDMQNALLNLIGGDAVELGSWRETASRMAGSDAARMVLEAMPAAVGVAGVAQVGDMIFGEENMSNDAMDLLGMGGGAAIGYGVNRGTNAVGGSTTAGSALSNSRKLAILASMLGGKTTVDMFQGDN